MKSHPLSTVIIFLILFQIKGEGINLKCGERVDEGQWPWHAAIYSVTKQQGAEYICGGTLVGSNTVLTAAHCVSKYNVPMDPENVEIKLGKVDLSLNESRSQHFTVIHFSFLWFNA